MFGTVIGHRNTVFPINLTSDQNPNDFFGSKSLDQQISLTTVQVQEIDVLDTRN